MSSKSTTLNTLLFDPFCLRKKFLVFNLVSRNLKIKYRRSIVGIFWTLLSPTAMGFVYYFVFKIILKVQIPHYLAFVLSGVMPWAFFNQTVLEGMESIVGNWGIVSKVPIPIQVFSYVNALTNLTTLFLAIPVLIGASVFTDVPLSLSVLCLPFLLLALFLIAYFVSLILSILFVFFRDLRHLMGIILQLWFYATPVIYEEGMIPNKHRWIIEVNPLATVFIAIHKVMAQGVWPTRVELLTVAFWCVFFYLIGNLVLVFGRREIVENI